jgi:hypothetical protein
MDLPHIDLLPQTTSTIRLATFYDDPNKGKELKETNTRDQVMPLLT